MNIAEELSRVYEMLQRLNIQPTVYNMRILTDALDAIQACWNELSQPGQETVPTVRVLQPEEVGTVPPPEAVVIRPAEEAGEG